MLILTCAVIPVLVLVITGIVIVGNFQLKHHQTEVTFLGTTYWTSADESVYTADGDIMIETLS